MKKLIKNKYFKLVSTNESKETIKKKNQGPGSKIRDLLSSMAKNSDDYDEKYMKIKLDSNNDLPLNTTIGDYNVTIVGRAIFYKNNKFCPQVFLQECFYKL